MWKILCFVNLLLVLYYVTKNFACGSDYLCYLGKNMKGFNNLNSLLKHKYNFALTHFINADLFHNTL